jgi:hypothetical protein
MISVQPHSDSNPLHTGARPEAEWDEHNEQGTNLCTPNDADMRNLLKYAPFALHWAYEVRSATHSARNSVMPYVYRRSQPPYSYWLSNRAGHVFA